MNVFGKQNSYFFKPVWIALPILLFFFEVHPQMAFWQALPPLGFTYSELSPTYTKWTTITNNTPSFSGGAPVTHYTISPALPTGLVFNTTTGVISGQPEQSDESGSTYTLTAFNPGGTAELTLNITVVIPDFTWLGSTDSSWSTNSNWKGGSAPGASDSAIFDDEGSSQPAVISSNVTVQNIDLKSNFTGSLTLSAANTFTVTRNADAPGTFTQEGGTFTAGSGRLEMDRLHLINGTFTSTSGTLQVGYDRLGTGAAYSENHFVFGSAAVFNHNNGLLRAYGEGGNNSYNRLFAFDLDQELSLYNLEVELISNQSDKNAGYGTIYGSNTNIRVVNDLDILDGHMYFGDIIFEGADVHFHCDSPTTPVSCSQTRSIQVSSSGVEGTSGTNVQFAGGSAQTYTFDDGAGWPDFLINNLSGVSTSSSGTFSLNNIHINVGEFIAPSGTLNMGGNVRVDDNFWGGFLISASGTFNHNNGEVVFNSQTFANGSLCVMKILSNNGDLFFYNLTIDVLGDSNNNESGSSGAFIGLQSGLFLRVLNDFRTKDGRLEGLDGGTHRVYIKGDYYHECSSITPNHRCAEQHDSVDFFFDGTGQNIIFTSPVNLWGNSSKLRILSGSDVTMASGFLNSTGGGFGDLTVDSGASLHLNNGTGIKLGDDLANYGAITCTGSGFLTYSGGLYGPAQAGDDPACYGATASDVSVDSVDWPDSSGSTPLRTITGINGSVSLQINYTVVSGAPSLSFRRVDHSFWTDKISGQSFSALPDEQFQFRILESTNEIVDVTINNMSDGGVLVDTFRLTGNGTPDQSLWAATNWPDFFDNSANSSMVGINTTVSLRLDSSQTLGAPSLEYRKNSGAWTFFTPGAPPTLVFQLNDTLQFRITGAEGEEAQIQVVNLDDSNAIVDTIAARVSDITLDAMDWLDFSSLSSSENLTGINKSITVQLNSSYLSGTPTLQYRVNLGGWNTFTPGLPPNFAISNNDSLQFQVLGASTESAQIQVINVTDSSNTIDTITGTVP